MTNEKSVAKRNDEQPQSGVASLRDIDFQELFQFEEKDITLDASEAWMLNNRVMPFGKGSRRLATEMGLEFLMPERIFVNDEWHSNPHIVWKDGVAIGIFILKHGIAIAPEGIRYLQPNLDYVDLQASIATMAMNTAETVWESSKDGAKNCSRAIFEKMKAAWEKPGDPDWFFVPTLDADTGIAFNQNEGGEAGNAIRKLQSDMIGMRKNPLRKLQTATDRLVLEKLFPEVLTSIDEGSIVKCDNYGNTNPRDPKYLKKVKSATFKIKVPTKAPIARTLLMELAIALRDNDPEARERKFAQTMNALGGTVNLREIPSGRIQAEDIANETESGKIQDAEPVGNNLPPVPINLSLRNFKKWVIDNYNNFTPKQQIELHRISGAEEGKATQINKSNWRELYQIVMDWAGIEPPSDDDEKSSNEMREEMLEWLMEQDGKMGFLGKILEGEDLNPDVDFNLIPDEQIEGIYSKFITQLKNQEQDNDVSN